MASFATSRVLADRRDGEERAVLTADGARLSRDGALQAALLGLWPKASHSIHKRADAWRDADQQVGRWLFHGDHLDDAC